MPRKQKKYHYIYKTTNIITNKYYIGMHSTDDIGDGYIGSGKRLWYSINKHGKENHNIEILEYLSNRKELSNKEKEIVNEELLNDKMCMNLVIGGVGGIFNEEHHEKMKKGASKFLKDKWKDEKYRNKTLKMMIENTKKTHREGKLKYDNFKDKHHTEETKIKMSKSSKGTGCGEKNSQFGTCWITNSKKNKKIKKNNLLLEDGWRLGRI